MAAKKETKKKPTFTMQKLAGEKYISVSLDQISTVRCIARFHKNKFVSLVHTKILKDVALLVESNNTKSQNKSF